MKLRLLVICIVLSMALMGCAQVETPLALSLAEACTPDSEVEFLRRTVIMDGILIDDNMFCLSDVAGIPRCGVTLAESLEAWAAGEDMIAYFVQGSEANQIEEFDRLRVSLDELVLRAADDSRIDVRQPIQITGEVLTTTSACTMNVGQVRQIASG
jgi:hypothetical protein